MSPKRLPIPIASRTNRLPEAGRIRIGKKGPVKTSKKGNEYQDPIAIDTFRFTSHRKEDLEQLAGLYGGEVRPWSDPKAAAGQFEVITTASEITVALPPDPLGDTPIYRAYSGGGPDRRCDGETCERWRKGPDGAEPYDEPCVCLAEGVMVCDATTMLSVLIPEIRFGGTWRIVTKSENASKELPGMVALVSTLQGAAGGLPLGTLSIQERREQRAGEVHIFKVPVLGTSVTPNEITSGGGVLGAALPAGNGHSAAAPALNAGGGSGAPVGVEGGGTPSPAATSEAASVPPPSGSSPDPDDDVVDAEIVDDGAAPATSTTDNEDLRALMKQRGLSAPNVNRMIRKLAAVIGGQFDTPPKTTEIGPSPFLDALYAWIDSGGGPDDDPPGGDDPGPGGPVAAPEPAGGGEAAAPTEEEAGGSLAAAPPEPTPSGDNEPATPATAPTPITALLARMTKMQKPGDSPLAGYSKAAIDSVRHLLIGEATGGRTTSSADPSITKPEALHAHRLLDEIRDGEARPHLRGNGDWEIQRGRAAA
jgi:hypothetical protein